MSMLQLRPTFKIASFKRLLVALICTQITLQPLLTHAAQEPAAPLSPADGAYADIDPMWKAFAEGPADDLHLLFDAKDPAIDHDPFFMRAQSWVSSGSSGYRKTNHGLEIGVAGKTLNLAVPMQPLQATTDFIFLTVTHESDLFQKAAGREAPGEGLFFLDRAELKDAAQSGAPVPVYFFPLGGSGWRGALSSIELPQADKLVVANNTDSVAIDLRDVETAMKAQRINLVMAQALNARNHDDVAAARYPARGMTAAFGLFFTGIDLDSPSKNLWAGNDASALSLFKKKWAALVLPLMGVNANASPLPPELMARIAYVGSVLTGMLAASIVIKYWQPGVRRKIHSQRTGEPKSLLKKGLQQTKEIFDVFAPITTTSAQIASVSFAAGLEAFLDRFAPTLAASEHTLVRRFLNNTFYFSRNSMKGAATNAKTFVYGAFVMGGVDTAMVAVQYQFAVPLIAEVASHHLGPDMQHRIDVAFDPNNPNTKQIALQDEVRTGIAYLQSGAASYALDARSQNIETVTKEVETQMRARGLDPMDPKNESKKRDEIERKMNLVMVQKGLPGKNQFLFDANTLVAQVPKILGYSAPEGVETQESFLLERRFGLSLSALSKAVAAAKIWAKNEPSPAANEALAILQETQSSAQLVLNGVLYGQPGVERARQVRQQLTLLSYEGPIAYGLKYMPETWSKRYSPEAAQAAGLIFRQSLFSFLMKEGDNLLFADVGAAERFGQQAQELTLREMKAAHPEISSTIPESMQLEWKLRLQIKITDLAREHQVNENASGYKSPRLDWIARRQQARALEIANEKMNAYLQTPKAQNASETQLADVKRRFVQDAFARQVGLYIEDPEVAAAQGRADYVEMLASVESGAKEALQTELDSSPDIRAYIAKLSEPERADFLTSLYANHFLIQYKEKTTELEMVKPTDPAQPGRFQRLRQTEIVRNSAFLTRTLRTLEAFGDDQSLKLGWYGQVARNLPLAEDLISSHRRFAKTFLPMMTVNYAWNYFAWQVHLPYSTWLVMSATVASTIWTPSQWLNRVFRLNGLKPMDNIPSKIMYALPYSWVTFLGLFPIVLYSKDMAAVFSDYIRDPFLSTMAHIDPKIWIAAAATGVVGSIRSKLKAKRDFDEKKPAPLKGHEPMSCEELMRGAS